MPRRHLASVAAVPAANNRSADDPLLSFDTESAVSTAVPPSVPVLGRTARTPILAGALALVLVMLALVAFQARRAPGEAAASTVATTGLVNITSEPPGAGIAIDGQPKGTTPLRLSLKAGQHLVDVTSGEVKRSMPVTVDAGTLLNQHIEFARGIAATTGRLEITTDPAGAQVTIDGTPRGTTPLTIAEMPGGEHKVTISRDGASVERTVTVSAGATATVMATTPVAGTAAGWVQIKAPIELQVFEGGRMIGTTAADRLMLPAGRHDLEVANAPFEFRATVRVDVAPNKTAAAAIALPTGQLSINAQPWADVSIDGRPIGPTPLGNVSVPIGSHEVIWRHPQLGERRQTVSVTAVSPVRIGMDLTK